MEKKFKIFQKGNMKHLSLDEFEKFFNISYQPTLYFKTEQFKQEVIKACPWLFRREMIKEEMTNLFKRFEWEITTGYVAPIYLKDLGHPIGYGAFSQKKIKENDFVAEYTGEVKRVDLGRVPSGDYSMAYPRTWFSLHYFTIDAEKRGNLSRFFNHSEKPNLEPFVAMEGGLLHVIFLAKKEIAQDEELCFDYGTSYWSNRKIVQRGNRA